ncbi:MAG: Atg14 domain-containing protein [Microscillaceae bacterium]|jgi:hypothetical protein|nr:Atg14 domain-containing protein [Microscillaceae bacterium]
MKWLILVGLFLFIGFTVEAQKLTKAQRKEYRKRGKELRKEFKEKYNDPQKFKQLKEDNNTSRRRLDSLKLEIERIKQEEQRDQERLELLKRERDTEQERIAQLEKMRSQAKRRTIPTSGSFYTVQIGNISEQELNQIIQNNQVDLNVASDEAGNDFFILGWYDNAQKAKELQRYIKAMGIRNTNVIGFKDGKLMKPNGKI